MYKVGHASQGRCNGLVQGEGPAGIFRYGVKGLGVGKIRNII